MKSKISLYVSIAILITILLGWGYYMHWQGSQGAYPVGSCFKDREMKIKFKVLKITTDAYEIEVMNSGHYTMSPDFFKGNVLLYSKTKIDTQKNTKYHPAICIEPNEQANPNE